MSAQEKRSRATEALNRFLHNVSTIENWPEERQLQKTVQNCQSICNVPIPPEQQRQELFRVLQRYRTFKSLPTCQQLQYLRNIINWCQAAAGKNDANCVTYLLPGLCHYVHSVRAGTYAEERDGNWFEWWQRQRARLQQDAGTVFADEARIDRQMLEQIRLYESATRRQALALSYSEHLLLFPPISDKYRV
ncbi:hypothetical protein F4804DRAFT_335784 [Jackrogersella minutella]|nr:hypothetical protein F4804DRAFT_335784 [Jackrogersella minutella]